MEDGKEEGTTPRGWPGAVIAGLGEALRAALVSTLEAAEGSALRLRYPFSEPATDGSVGIVVLDEQGKRVEIDEELMARVNECTPDGFEVVTWGTDVMRFQSVASDETADGEGSTATKKRRRK